MKLRRSSPWKAERVERARIELGVAGKDFDDRVRALFLEVSEEFSEMDLVAGDSVSLTYEFTISYHNVARQMQAIIALLREDVVWADVELFEKSGGEILIAELVTTLRDVQDALDARKS